MLIKIFVHYLNKIVDTEFSLFIMGTIATQQQHNNERHNMNNDRLAVNTRTALKMFWDAGYNTEDLLTKAATLIKTLTPVSNEFYYADEVANLINN